MRRFPRGPAVPLSHLRGSAPLLCDHADERRRLPIPFRDPLCVFEAQEAKSCERPEEIGRVDVDGPDGTLVPVNGIQGVWPLEGEKPLGMGFGKTLADVRTWVAREPATPLFIEGRALHDTGDTKGALGKFKESLRL